MRSLKMISVMLLIGFSVCGFQCQEKYNIDRSIFSWDHQKFYQSNDYTGEKAAFTCQDPRADKLVCAPYDQYIKFQQDYVCKRK